MNFDEELKKLDADHKAWAKSKMLKQTRIGYDFDKYLKEEKISPDEYDSYPEWKQTLLYNEYEYKKTLRDAR